QLGCGADARARTGAALGRTRQSGCHRGRRGALSRGRRRGDSHTGVTRLVQRELSQVPDALAVSQVSALDCRLSGYGPKAIMRLASTDTSARRSALTSRSWATAIFLWGSTI